MKYNREMEKYMKNSCIKRLLASFLACLLLLGLLSGCGKEEKAETANPAEREMTTENVSENFGTASNTSGAGKKIGFTISQMAGSPFWQVLLDSMKSGFEAKEYEFVYGDAGGDVSTQLQNVQDFIAQGCDAIIINCSNPDSMTDVTYQCKDAGIPVFAIDSPLADDAYCVATWVCDSWGGGLGLGRHAASLLAGKSAIDAVILSGWAGGKAAWNRRYGFITGLNEYQIDAESKASVNILYQSYCDYEQEKAYETMKDVYTRFNGDFDVVFCENDAMALGAATAISDSGGNPSDYIIMGVDAIRLAYEAIMEGTMTATALNSPVSAAEMTVAGVDAYLNGDTSIRGEYYTELAIITKDNVEEYYDANSIY